ncbi:MAG TPA: T9SS type A sorting domain-containing protein [Bacteroidetes bacterium]|nr:T9SS type A sorting domain-containing protein [Bacteroidota bacterium]
MVDKDYKIIDVEPHSDTVLIYQSPITELVEADLSSMINVFPNPAKEIFYITRNKAFEAETSVYVYDLYGKIILSHEDVASWPLKIQTGHWASGIYILDVNINDFSQKKRLIIE